MDERGTPMNAKECLRYLRSQHGLTFSLGTLYQMRTHGTGPPCENFGRLVYWTLATDAWVKARQARAAARARHAVRRSWLHLPDRRRVRVVFCPPPPGGHVYDWSEFVLIQQGRA